MRTMISVFLGVCLCGVSTACRKPVGNDQVEKDHPKIKQARLLVQQQDPRGAEALLQEALRAQPELALAHLQLGMLYQSEEKPISSLYHFQRYLEARPDSRMAETLGPVIEVERRRLAEQVERESEAPGSDAAQSRRLQEELSTADQRIAELEIELQQARFRSGTAPDLPPPDWAAERLSLLQKIQELQSGSLGSSAPAEREVSSAEQTGQTYTVRRGDTLSGIAQRAYGRASAWSTIYEANRGVIPNKNVLSPGTVLVLP